MGADSAVEWCHDTLNVWLGCDKVSAGCKHCYAEQETPVRVHRGRGLELWGPKAARYETKSWQKNLASYVRKAVSTGERRRVFAQSLSDTFEDREDLVDVRRRFFEAVDALDSAGSSRWRRSPLDMLLLTKRPQNVLRMVPKHWLVEGCWPDYVWIGATVEDQEMANERIPHLLAIPAGVRFLSVEPQIGPVRVDDIGEPGWVTLKPLAGLRWVPRGDGTVVARTAPRISWVIQGGESGSKVRTFDLAWARSLRDQCAAAGVPFFLKQLGANVVEGPFVRRIGGCMADGHDKHNGDESRWPADLRGCRTFPTSRAA